MTPKQREQLIANAEIIGSTIGYAFSGGKAENVGIAGGIAGSATQNNYLTHDQWKALRDKLKACGNDDACREKALSDSLELSEAQNAELDACTTDKCRADHLAKIAAAEGIFKDMVLELGGVTGTYLSTSQLSSAKGVNWTAGVDAEFKVAVRDEMTATFCGGGAVIGCDMSALAQLEGYGALSADESEQLGLLRVQELIKKEAAARDEMAADLCGGIRDAACDTRIDAAT